MSFSGERTTLRLILVKQLGYKFKKCKNARVVLTQKPDIAAWRARYLRRMKDNNDLGVNKKPVTFVDETWIHSQSARVCWQNSSNGNVKKITTPGECWILAHAGGENGFIPGVDLLYKCKSKTGDFDKEMTTKIFVKWLKENLIPNLPPNSIVVIDDAPYHSTQAEKIPSRSSLKNEMQEWLSKNNITFEKEMSKPELYNLTLVNKPEKKYVVDELLRQHGHEIVRLPPYHSDLNPLEYLWDLIKRRVADKKDQLENFEQLTRDEVKLITAADWKNYVNHVERLQKEYWESDRLQEIHEREFIISLGGEESSSESESGSEQDDNDSDMSGIEELNDSED